MRNSGDSDTRKNPGRSNKNPPKVTRMKKGADEDSLPPISTREQLSENLQEENKVISFTDKPVQLVRIDQRLGKFQICDEGIKMLQNIETDIGIVSFTGLYRTGKSFTLNLLLDKLGKGVLIF